MDAVSARYPKLMEENICTVREQCDSVVEISSHVAFFSRIACRTNSANMIV